MGRVDQVVAAVVGWAAECDVAWIVAGRKHGLDGCRAVMRRRRGVEEQLAAAVALQRVARGFVVRRRLTRLQIARGVGQVMCVGAGWGNVLCWAVVWKISAFVCSGAACLSW